MKSPDIKVSVIIPVYNAEKYLRQCLDSVLGQTLREIEVICVDDGSTDSSLAIIREYAAKAPRLRLLTQPNSGAGAARNLGIENANGEYIAFVDADDWVERRYCESLYASAEKYSADVTVCNAQRVDAKTGKNLPSEWMLKEKYIPSASFSPLEIKKYIFQFTYGQVWDKLFRTGFLNAHKLRFPTLRAAEDTSFAYIALLEARKIAVCPEILLNYRVNVDGSTSNSFVKYPDAPFQAFRLVYDYLIINEKYELFEQSFLNWAMEYLVWQVCNMPDKEIQEKYYHEVKDNWFPLLKLGEYPRKKIYEKFTYYKFLCISRTALRLLRLF